MSRDLTVEELIWLICYADEKLERDSDAHAKYGHRHPLCPIGATPAPTTDTHIFRQKALDLANRLRTVKDGKPAGYLVSLGFRIDPDGVYSIGGTHRKRPDRPGRRVDRRQEAYDRLHGIAPWFDHLEPTDRAHAEGVRLRMVKQLDYEPDKDELRILEAIAQRVRQFADTVCPECRGRGRVRIGDGPGELIAMPCDPCLGTGKRDPCQTCKGTGKADVDYGEDSCHNCAGSGLEPADIPF